MRSLPGTIAAHQLTTSIKNKCTAEEVFMIIKDLPNPLQEEDSEPTYNPLKIDVFVQTLLFLGSKSISHTFAAIAKFHYIFKTLAVTEEAQICILRNAFELWRQHQQMMTILVDKMLKTQIVECFAVANWIFSKEMVPEFTKIYVWEILHLTIRKMNKHVQKLQKEVDDARDKLAKVVDLCCKILQGDENSNSEKERPTEEMIERMEERLEAAQADQKNLFLIIFQRFIMILTEHIAKRESEGRDSNTFWYRWTIGRLQQVFLTHHDQVFRYISTLETLLFTTDTDPHILQVFQQFARLRT
uniref:MIF4G-like type 2 domain-containing protein n=1 Tax=Strigamia maritima TaxID=126957 RepID=T1JFR4_STRMM